MPATEGYTDRPMRLRAVGPGLSGLASLLGVLVSGAPLRAADLKWTELEPGLEYATTEAPGPRPLALPIDDHIHLVRVDPKVRSLEAVMAGAGDGRSRTAAQWCRERHLAVAINMGMFQTDRRTNTGYARSPGYVNNGHWAAKYKAALGFGPLKKDATDAGDGRPRRSGRQGAPRELRHGRPEPPPDQGRAQRLGAAGAPLERGRRGRRPTGAPALHLQPLPVHDEGAQRHLARPAAGDRQRDAHGRRSRRPACRFTRAAWTSI